MAAQTLSRDAVAFGRAVLLATDALDMAVEGAFWMYDPEDDQWRFFLVTSLVDRMGPREIYQRLNEAFAKKLSESEARDFTLYIASPADKLVKELRRSFRSGPQVSEPVEIDAKINGEQTPVCAYRLASGLDEDEAKRVQRRFRRRVNELATV